MVEELLRQEQNDLPAEIHHTDSPSLGDELQKRQALVAAILDRMRLHPQRGWYQDAPPRGAWVR